MLSAQRSVTKTRSLILLVFSPLSSITIHSCEELVAYPCRLSILFLAMILDKSVWGCVHYFTEPYAVTTSLLVT